MMFYCEECRVKKEWPKSFSHSYGGCELCGSIGICYDRPSRSLPCLPACGRATHSSPSTSQAVDLLLASQPVAPNHEEAYQLACMKRDESNLARAYLDLRATPPSPSTAPIAEDEKHKATLRELLVCFASWEPDVRVLGNVRAEDAFQAIRAALSSRPAGEVELPPLPEPDGSVDVLVDAEKCIFTAADAWSGPLVRAYGQECASAALASKPTAIDAEEVASVIEGALVDDLLPHHSPEWVERARAAVLALRASTSAKEPPCGS